MENESQTDREGQMWDSNGSGSETKRQRLSNGTFRRTSEVSLGSPVNSQPLYEFGRLDSGSKTELANVRPSLDSPDTIFVSSIDSCRSMYGPA